MGLVVDSAYGRSQAWRWSVCVLLLFATLLNYMDRQTLAQLAPRIIEELNLTKAQYGGLELAFGIAFAVGMIIFGSIADRISVRWVYPFVLVGWSLAGIATGYAPEIGKSVADAILNYWGDNHPTIFDSPTYLGFAICRFVLGLFEAGQWPCALITTQAILADKDRSFGNSILQSGASLGAILTPLVVMIMLTKDVDSWRGPFKVIGFMSLLWVIPWFLMIRSTDLPRTLTSDDPDVQSPSLWSLFENSVFRRRFAALLVVVIAINLTWQFFRAWLPLLLKTSYGFEENAIYIFTIAYYISTDVGCITVGALVKFLAGKGVPVHTARIATFGFCCLLTTLSLLVLAVSQAWLIAGIFLVVGFGALGLFPNYYAFTQELTVGSQGKVSGVLGATTWFVTASMQWTVGKRIDETGSFAYGIIMAGVVPLFGLIAMLALWGREKGAEASMK